MKEKPKGKPSEVLKNSATCVGIFFFGGLVLMGIVGVGWLLLTGAGMATQAIADATGFALVDVREFAILFIAGGIMGIAAWVIGNESQGEQ